jgi:hypothetical protein
MSRWHNESCDNPDVYIDGGSTPCCRGCGGSAETTLKGTEQMPSSPFLRTPTDEPAGKMNLKWPSTVPYVQTRLDGTIVQVHGPSPRDEDHPLNLTSASKGIDSGSHSTTPIFPTYGMTLALDQFRLACLSAADSESTACLLHLDLEVYQDHNCPDYDATSYTWGGEDDDSRL